MSVEAHELMSDEWTRWQGHVVNGVFPLGRCLGCSEHSGVFLTRSGTPGHGEVAIKLFAAGQGHAELQLPRWARAGGLPHPCLLPLLEWGECQLDGLPYLYVVMEYADQTLTQLLLQRALTAEEAREMLRPILDALTFLHRQDLVQGELKPANILVVGSQLKLASDTIRHISDNTLSLEASSYDPPEGRDGSSSTAGDIWALGVSLFEALTRHSPSTVASHRNPVVLPADFSPEFRDVVAGCLSHKPQDRPTVMELVAWMGGPPAKPMPDTANQPAARERPEPRTSEATPPRTVPSEFTLDAARPVRSMASFPKPVAWVGATLVAVVILALGWTGVSFFRAHRTPDALASNPPATPAPQISAAAPPATAQPPAPVPVPAPSTTNSGRSDAIQRFALHEVIPDVPRSAARTIRGHLKVSVRAIVGPDGSVSTVVADRGGPSRYFQRLAVEAAKKWTFTPVHADSPRPVRIQFDFSRDGTTGHAVPIH